MSSATAQTALWPDGLRQAEEHYTGLLVPLEYEDLPECAAGIENIGWTLGNECPYRCRHCYSMSARRQGMDLTPEMVRRVVSQLAQLGVKTVNLGGNEPLFTNGADPRRTLLPFIIESLVERGIHVGLTTSGISLVHLERDHNQALRQLNDVDVSLDSPDELEHDSNRGARLYPMAIRALEICQAYGIDRSIILCAMNWNFSAAHVDGIAALARRHGAYVRVNPMKPVEPVHMQVVPDAATFYQGFARLISQCATVDLGEPLLAAACAHPGQGCPCGRSSFRIHSVTPDGRVPVSPCVYMHEYKVGDLLTGDLSEIIQSPAFRSFRRRSANPEKVAGCEGCEYLRVCRGGCAARGYLYNLHHRGVRSLYHRDPYCLRDAKESMGSRFPVFPGIPHVPRDKVLVHRDYLCTWIGKPDGTAESAAARHEQARTGRDERA